MVKNMKSGCFLNVMLQIIQQIISEQLPYIPVLIGSSLTEYNNSRVTGWPTQEDLYCYPMSWSAPDNAQVLKTVVPV